MRAVIVVVAALGVGLCAWLFASWSDEPSPGPEGAVAPGGTSVETGSIPGPTREDATARMGRLSVELSAEGVALQGVALRVVDAGGSETWAETTGPSGPFESGPLMPGTYHVGAAPGYPFAPVDQPVQVAAGETTSLALNLEASHEVPLRAMGTAPGAPVTPLAGATVEVVPTGGGAAWQSVTDHEGRVRITGLPSGGYRITVRATDHATQVLDRHLDAGVAHREGLPKEQLVRLPRSKGALRGVLRDPEGRPLGGRWVCMVDPPSTTSQRFQRRRRAAPAGSGTRAQSDADGRFSLEYPDRGQAETWLLVFPEHEELPPMYGWALPTDWRDTHEQVLELPRCHPVTVRLEDSTGATQPGVPRILWRNLRIPGQLFSLRWQDYVSLGGFGEAAALARLEAEEGAFHLFLPPGDYELTWMSTGESPRLLPLPPASFEVTSAGVDQTFQLAEDPKDG